MGVSKAMELILTAKTIKAAEAKEIETGINEIIDGVKGIASDLGKQLRKMMDV